MGSTNCGARLAIVLWSNRESASASLFHLLGSSRVQFQDRDIRLVVGIDGGRPLMFPALSYFPAQRPGPGCQC